MTLPSIISNNINLLTITYRWCCKANEVNHKIDIHICTHFAVRSIAIDSIAANKSSRYNATNKLSNHYIQLYIRD